MAYRNDVDALEARHRALEAELADRVRERDDVARMLADARARVADEQARAAVVPAPARSHPGAMLAGAVLALIAIVGVVEYRKDHRRSSRVHETLVRFEAWADEICRCQDSACTQRTIDAMTAWSAGRAAERQISMPVDDAILTQFQVISERFSRCMMRIAAQTSATRSDAQ